MRSGECQELLYRGYAELHEHRYRQLAKCVWFKMLIACVEISRHSVEFACHVHQHSVYPRDPELSDRSVL